MFHSLIRKIFFSLEPETAHQVGLFGLDFLNKAGLACLLGKIPENSPVTVMGLDFPNPVGLAAGLDKDGRHVDALAALGFGFIEVGTVTPRPQSGNLKPRLFRNIEHKALISRMGLNNRGLEQLAQNISNTRFQQLGGILGVNICKNNDTPAEQAIDDYRLCIGRLYPLASYIALNISWLNAQGFPGTQQGEILDELLKDLKAEQARQANIHEKHVPLVLKVSPDLDDEMIHTTALLLQEHKIDGLIATNSAFSREEEDLQALADEKGALSGQPLSRRSTVVLRKFAKALSGEIPIIASGGIMSGQDAASKIEAGASLVQIYSGLIYRDPDIINEIATQITRLSNPAG